MVHHLSLIEKVDLLIKEESSTYGNNPQNYSERVKNAYFQKLKYILENYNKEYLEDLGMNLLRMNLSNQLRQKSDNK